MNLKSLNDSALVNLAETLVREEREKLTQFLHHLKEIDRRRLFSSYGYKSLFDMTVKHFGYSEDEAYRRISAMRLLKEIPEVEEKINQGEVTLTHLALAQKHFRQEKKIQSREITTHEKVSLIEQISNTSVREAEKITLALSSNPEPVRPDKVRTISENKIEMKFSASIETQEKIEILKGLLAHKHPNLTLGELFDLLCDMGLKELNPGKVAAPKKTCITTVKSQNAEIALVTKSMEIAKSKAMKVPKSKAQIRREVFFKAKNQCEVCGSTHALEIDHIKPKALGGEDSVENLRLLCRNCNQRAAIKSFGMQKMERYLN